MDRIGSHKLVARRLREISIIGILIVVFVLPFRSIFIIFSGTSILKPVGVIVGLLWLLSILANPDARYVRLPRFYIPLLAFVLFNLLSVSWSVDRSLTISSILSYILILGLVTIIWDTCEEERRLIQVLQMFVLGSFVPAALIVSDFLTTPAGSAIRFGRGSFDINAIGGMLALATPIAWNLASNRNSNLPIFLNYLFIPLSVFAVLLTGSRQSIVALLPTILYITFDLFTSYQNRSVKLGVSGAILLTVLGVSMAIPSELLMRITDIPSAVITANSMQERFATWAAGIEALIRQPFLGVGSGAYQSAIIPFKSRVHASDTTFLTILVEVGVVGFIIFISYFLFVFRSVLHHLLSRDLLWPVVLSAWLPIALMNNWENAPVTWILFTLSIKTVYLTKTNQPATLISEY